MTSQNITGMKMIDERIATLKEENKQTLAEYLEAPDADLELLAERNMRILLELKFLNELSKEVKNVNHCEECSKELERGSVFCTSDCRRHYHSD